MATETKTAEAKKPDKPAEEKGLPPEGTDATCAVCGHPIAVMRMSGGSLNWGHSEPEWTPRHPGRPKEPAEEKSKPRTESDAEKAARDWKNAQHAVARLTARVKTLDDDLKSAQRRLAAAQKTRKESLEKMQALQG